MNKWISGTLLLCGCLNGASEVNEWKRSVGNAGIEPEDVLLLTLEFWCQDVVLTKPCDFLERLYLVILALCELKGN